MSDEVMEFNVEAAADSIGSDLFPSETVEAEPEQESADAAPVEAPVQPEKVEEPVAAPVEQPVVKPAPKSWAKETHEVWSKLDPQAQAYIEKREQQMLDGLEQYRNEAGFAKSLRGVIEPYKQVLQAAGLNETTAVQSLLNAHYRLTQGSQEQRISAYRELGRNLGLQAQDENQAQPDPELLAVKQEVTQLRQSLTQREQAAQQEAHSKVAKEVEVFASDPAHPYFEDVADDMMVILQGSKATLQEAYEKAIWANPVTRAKEQARILTEHETKLKENARLEALPKQKAKSVNVKSRDTGRAPTEPLGSWEDTMRGVLAARNSGSN